MSPGEFAHKALQSVAKNKAIIILPLWWKLFWWINRLLPTLGIYLAQRFFQKMQKQLGIA
jgi:short-subunit dehydrogenase